MSRALRRHPVSSKPAKGGGGAKPPRPPKGAAQTRVRHGWRRFLPGFADDIISELRKVTWPTRHETVNLTIVVITVSVAISILLGGVDMFFNWLISSTLLR
jgi:preprotein translocase subunit SecE